MKWRFSRRNVDDATPGLPDPCGRPGGGCIEEAPEAQAEPTRTWNTREEALFLVQELDTRRAKALLQTILSAAHVYRDGRIELEFRAQQTR